MSCDIGHSLYNNKCNNKQTNRNKKENYIHHILIEVEIKGTSTIIHTYRSFKLKSKKKDRKKKQLNEQHIRKVFFKNPYKHTATLTLK